jgi:hypothetical protein
MTSRAPVPPAQHVALDPNGVGRGAGLGVWRCADTQAVAAAVHERDTAGQVSDRLGEGVLGAVDMFMCGVGDGVECLGQCVPFGQPGEAFDVVVDDAGRIVGGAVAASVSAAVFSALTVEPLC